MSHTKADLELWRHLYQAAIEFKKLAPWEWMLDSYMFGVKNQATGAPAQPPAAARPETRPG
jgi:hypothetical protein